MEKVTQSIFDTAELSDVTLVCGVATFKLHKLLLSIVSPVFKAMFAHDGLEENKTNVVKMDDFDMKTIKTFFELAYGEVAFNGITFEVARDCLILCDKYDLAKSLRANLEKVIEKSFLNEWETASTFAILGNKFKFPDVQMAAMRQMKSQITSKRDFSPLKECPDVLTELLIWSLENWKRSRY